LELSSAEAAVAEDLAADPAAGQPTDSTISSESLPVDLVVYAFSEEFNEQGRPIPTFYLGEHKVAASQDGSVTLEPTLPLSEAQQAFINSGAATSWTLYELMPIDSHTAFAAPGSQPTDEEIFGRMDEETIRALLANVPAEEGRQEQLIASYMRDGQQARNDDPSDRVWVQRCFGT
jgi:hypothetical protein